MKVVLLKIRTFSELNRAIEQKISLALKDKMAVKVKELIAYYLQKNFYDYTPEEYERTYELRDSLTIGDVVKKGSGYTVEVFFDTNKIQPHYESINDPFPQHISWSGEDVSNMIPYWTENALINPVSFRGQDRGFFVKSTVNDLKKNKDHIQELKTFLLNNGINVR